MIRVKRLPYVPGFVLAATFFFCLNLYFLGRSHELPSGGICMDCGLPVGFPFTMYRTEYMWGGEGYIASGVFANICVAIISGGLLGFVVSRIWRLVITRASGSNLK
jgi:hypothetical protein